MNAPAVLRLLRKPRSLCLVGALLIIISLGSARAERITFAFEGTVDSVFFDTDTPNTCEPVDEGQCGLYRHTSPPAGVRIGLAFACGSARGRPA
jgi:hypothetical protein